MRNNGARGTPGKNIRKYSFFLKKNEMIDVLTLTQKLNFRLVEKFRPV